MDNPIRLLRADVKVIKEGRHTFAIDRAELTVEGTQGGEERGHQGSPCSPPFSLVDAVRLATGINPKKTGGPTIEQADERQKGVGRRGAAKSTKHGVAADGIKRPDAINRQHSQVGVRVSGCARASVPARVDRANWYGWQAASNAAPNAAPNCCASMRATSFPATHAPS